MEGTMRASSKDESNRRTSQDESNITLDWIVAQINDNVAFAVVAQSILRAVCQRVNAREATLLVMASENIPLLRASFTSAHPEQLSNPPTGEPTSRDSMVSVAAVHTGSQYHVAIRTGGRMVGLLELGWGGDHQVSRREQHELETLANLTALLIRREQADHFAAALNAKVSQFELHKEEFIHLVSHQLRTPLTSIKGFAQLLARQQKNGNLNAVDRYSSTILQETDRLNTMINNLMELSRMEMAIIGIQRVPFVLNEVISLILADIANSPQIESSLSPHLPLGSGDPNVLRQALTILITHLLRTDNQHISITTSHLNHHLSVELSMTSDDWPERGNDDIESISLDQAVDSSDKQNSAMALYIVMNLTRAMGSTISLERASKDGSVGARMRYVLSLPLADASNDGGNIYPQAASDSSSLILEAEHEQDSGCG